MLISLGFPPLLRATPYEPTSSWISATAQQFPTPTWAGLRRGSNMCTRLLGSSAWLRWLRTRWDTTRPHSTCMSQVGNKRCPDWTRHQKRQSSAMLTRISRQIVSDLFLGALVGADIACVFEIWLSKFLTAQFSHLINTFRSVLKRDLASRHQQWSKGGRKGISSWTGCSVAY